MTSKTLTISIMIGCAAIALGLMPGLAEGIDRFRRSLGQGPFRPRFNAGASGRLPGQIWFAVAGVCLIALGLVGYLFR